MQDRKDVMQISKGKLLGIVLTRFVLVMIFLGGLLFISAGTLAYWNGWLYIAALSIPMSFALIYLFVKDPVLLEKRMRLREKEKRQKRYVKLSIVFFVISFVIPGLDFRYGWSEVPLWLVVLATVFMLAGYIMFMVVMMQNSYASRVIEVQDGQKVIDSGLYSIVRHPMYLAASILYLFSPVVLGSFFGIIPMLLLPFILAYRIKNEEEVLAKGLEGYKDYMSRVKYRLIPFMW